MLRCSDSAGEEKDNAETQRTLRFAETSGSCGESESGSTALTKPGANGAKREADARDGFG